MKKILFAMLAAIGMTTGNFAQADHIWLNEIHYDNASTDEGEFIEVGLRSPNASGFTAADYGIVLYNGSNGAAYATSLPLSMFDTISAPLAITGSASTITLYAGNLTSLVAASGIQNGPPDGFALVNFTNSTVEAFYSYEGTFAATDGLANGMMSTALGADEATAPAIGFSVGASGIGIGANQFTAASFIGPSAATPGTINVGQVFAVPIPEPGSIAALSAIACLGVYRLRRTRR